MLQIGFTLVEVTSLSYFIPLFMELDKRHTKFYIFCDGELSKPTALTKNSNIRYLDQWKNNVIWYQDFEDLLEKIEMLKLNYIFSAEAAPFQRRSINKSWKLVIIPTLTDYIELFPNYADIGDIFLSPGPIADNYLNYPPTIDVVRFGNPKYDVIESLKEKNSNKKVVVVFAPNKNIILKSFYILILIRIWALFSGFKIKLKTRDKHNSWILRILFKDINIDQNYYPSTSLELIQQSSFVILFDSTTFKECLLLNRPMVNFNVKNYRKTRKALDDFFKETQDQKSIFDLDGFFISPFYLFNVLKRVSTIDRSNLFQDLIPSWITYKKNSSELILDYINFKEKLLVKKPQGTSTGVCSPLP